MNNLKPPKTLGILLDTGHQGMMLALYNTAQGGLIARYDTGEPYGQADILFPALESLFAQTGTGYADVGEIVIARGPGAFTGLRVGFAFAQGLRLSLGAPIYGVSSFEAVLETYRRSKATPEEGPVLVLLDTKRQDYYTCFFDAAGAARAEPKVLNTAQIMAELATFEGPVIGDAAPRFAAQCAVDPARIHAIPSIDPLALMACRLRQTTPMAQALPYYLRSADVTLPKKKP